jgi:hypothetical protein
MTPRPLTGRREQLTQAGATAVVTGGTRGQATRGRPSPPVARPAALATAADIARVQRNADAALADVRRARRQLRGRSTWSLKLALEQELGRGGPC